MRQFAAYVVSVLAVLAAFSPRLDATSRIDPPDRITG